MRRDRKFQGTMPTNLILLPTVAAVALALAACDWNQEGQPIETFNSDQAQYAGICSDLHDRNNPDDDTRVDDDLCGDDDEDGNASNSGFSFVWIDLGSGHNQAVPAYGQKVPKGLGGNVHSKGAVVMKKLPATGFTKSDIKSGTIKPSSPIQRGGFGVSSAGKGSSGG